MAGALHVHTTSSGYLPSLRGVPGGRVVSAERSEASRENFGWITRFFVAIESH